MTRAQALKLYATACETHKRADWRLARHALHEAMTGGAVATPQPRAPKPGPSLCQYLANCGGIGQHESDLIAMDGDKWKGKPFYRKLVTPGGMGLDEAAGRALDAGYFDHVTLGETDNYHQIGPNELLAAIGREIAGRRQERFEAPEPEDDSGYWASVEADAQRLAA